jgi:hypothetical protein
MTSPAAEKLLISSRDGEYKFVVDALSEIETSENARLI